MHAAGIIPSMNSTIKRSKPYVYNLLIWKYSDFVCINRFDKRRDIFYVYVYIRICLFKIWNSSNCTFFNLLLGIIQPRNHITEK